MKPNPIVLPARPRNLRFDVQAVADGRFEIKADAATPTISVLDVIDSGFSARIAAALRQIGPRALTVEINSRGGDYFEGVAGANLLLRHPAPVTVQIVGLAGSAASVVAMGGDTIEIFATATIMIHNSQAVMMGDRHDATDLANTLAGLDRAMQELYSQRTGLPQDQVAQMMDNETFMSSAQAKELGFADTILDKPALPEPKPAAGTRASNAHFESKGELESAMRSLGLPKSVANIGAGAAWAKMRGSEPQGLDLDAIARVIADNIAATAPRQPHR